MPDHKFDLTQIPTTRLVRALKLTADPSLSRYSYTKQEDPLDDTEVDFDSLRVFSLHLGKEFVKASFCPRVRHIQEELSRRPVVDLTKIHSRKLLKLFSDMRSGWYHDYFDHSKVKGEVRMDPTWLGLPADCLQLGPTFDELRTELEKRPHMPSKREGKELRRKRAKQGGPGRADIR